MGGVLGPPTGDKSPFPGNSTKIISSEGNGEPMQRNNNSISSRVSLGDNKVLVEPVNKDRLGSMGHQCFDENTKSVVGCGEGILPLATQPDSTMLPATKRKESA